jgi:hypothetical protein
MLLFHITIASDQRERGNPGDSINKFDHLDCFPPRFARGRNDDP